MERNSLSGPATQDLSHRTRARFGLGVSTLGFIVLAIGAKPGWFGWDNSPTVGFVQVLAMLLGLGILSLGGFFGLLALWRGRPRTIPADIGMRLVATGYVISIFSGMADLFGMGTQTSLGLMHFGPFQARGLLIGQVVIAIGFLLMIPLGKNIHDS